MSLFLEQEFAKFERALAEQQTVLDPLAAYALTTEAVKQETETRRHHPHASGASRAEHVIQTLAGEAPALESLTSFDPLNMLSTEELNQLNVLKEGLWPRRLPDCTSPNNWGLVCACSGRYSGAARLSSTRHHSRH